MKNVNISPFIKNIPGSDTSDFSTERASGSTSEAANIMEAVDAGSKLLLIDEDRSATNFMIRDPVMRRLIKDEPITPFTERVQELSRMGISTILVIGGSGEYLSVADKVYIMQGLRLQAERITPLPLPTGHSTRAFLRAGLILTPEGWERSGCGCSTSE